MSEPLIEELPAGSVLWRIFRKAAAQQPLWFGPAADTPANERLRFHAATEHDTLAGPAFGVCYLGASPEACFAETFLRNPPVRLVSREELGERALARVSVSAALRVVAVHGAGLVRLGLTADVTSAVDYRASQALSHRLWSTTDADGLVYRSRHDNDQLAYALFDRCADRLRCEHVTPLDADRRWLGALASRYRFGIL